VYCSIWHCLAGILVAGFFLTGCASPSSIAEETSSTTTVTTISHVSPSTTLTAVGGPAVTRGDADDGTLLPTATITPHKTPLSHATQTESTAPMVQSVSSQPDAPTPAPRPTIIPADERQQIFLEVWNTVNENYLSPDFYGLNWQAIREEYAPRVAAASSNDAFYALLGTMVGQLDDHHSRFVAPSDVTIEDEQSVGVETHVGIGIVTTLVSDSVIIEEVVPGSPAEQAGLRSDDRIIAVEGIPCSVSPCPNIEGPVDTQVRLTVIRLGDQAHDMVITRRPVNVRVTPVARRLEYDIGYLRIPSLWISDMAVQVSGALTDLVVEKPLRGLIIDLRGNPGGWRDVLTGVLSHFVRGEVGIFFDRHSTKPLIVRESSGPDLRDLPLVVLIDGATASYAEVMAGILQVEADARVIGVHSSGNTETIYAYELQGGGRLWLAQEGFRLRNGVNLEGNGVQPDVVLDVVWEEGDLEHNPGGQD